METGKMRQHNQITFFDEMFGNLKPREEMNGYQICPGFFTVNGSTVFPGGVNFTIHSHYAESCELLLYKRHQKQPWLIFPFKKGYRLGNTFSIFIFGLDINETEYVYRFDGPYEPEKGFLFDKEKDILDPYARTVVGQEIWGKKSENLKGSVYRGKVVADTFDWGTSAGPDYDMSDLIIYEMHVRGFTRHPSSGVKYPGTFEGIREKIPYLKELGINAVELMPVFEFDELEESRTCQGKYLYKYWGYNTVSFFAPNASYGTNEEGNTPAGEFKRLIRDLHDNGIAVILDVVFNHTAEGNENGPFFSFKGIDNNIYYMLTPDGYYYNFSGCGNTMNCNHPIVRNMILNCLRYWVEKFRVDGFRFDLASVMGRNENGAPMEHPPILEELAFDPILGKTLLIAEAWDAGGMYQVGSFPSWKRWVEWNGKYRDDMRSFLKGDYGMAAAAIHRINGSLDLYPPETRGNDATVNFLNCHDGFTLYDLYAYNEKHNEANGWNNTDGCNNNLSWNCGEEGETSRKEVTELRKRMCKNAFATLMCSRGAAMFPAGDEFLNSQYGNNNPYCQDNEISWLNWEDLKKNQEMFEFCCQMIAFRKEHPVLRKQTKTARGGWQEISVHLENPRNNQIKDETKYFGILFSGKKEGPKEEDDFIYYAVNAYWEELTIGLPLLEETYSWFQIADTMDERQRERPILPGQSLTIGPRSVKIFVGRRLQTNDKNGDGRMVGTI